MKKYLVFLIYLRVSEGTMDNKSSSSGKSNSFLLRRQATGAATTCVAGTQDWIDATVNVDVRVNVAVLRNGMLLKMPLLLAPAVVAKLKKNRAFCCWSLKEGLGR